VFWSFVVSSKCFWNLSGVSKWPIQNRLLVRIYTYNVVWFFALFFTLWELSSRSPAREKCRFCVSFRKTGQLLTWHSEKFSNPIFIPIQHDSPKFQTPLKVLFSSDTNFYDFWTPKFDFRSLCVVDVLAKWLSFLSLLVWCRSCSWRCWITCTHQIWSIDRVVKAVSWNHWGSEFKGPATTKEKNREILSLSCSFERSRSGDNLSTLCKW
jgi:hypothetical protein